MPGAQVRGEGPVFRQGQDAARRLDAAVVDDHGSVVEGCLGEEDVADQLLGDRRVHLGAGGGHGLQGIRPLKDDQRADPFLGHGLAGLDHLLDSLDAVPLAGAVGQSHEALDGAFAADALQQAPQLRLEDDDQGHKAELKDPAQQIVDRV